MPPTQEEAHRRHAEYYYYLSALRSANSLYEKGHANVGPGLRLFDLEWENIRMGQAWAVAIQSRDPTLSDLCIAYPVAGGYVLNLRQHPKELIHWLETALSAARQIGDRGGEGTTLGNLGNGYAALGDIRKA